METRVLTEKELKTALSLQAASEQALEDLQKLLVQPKIKPPSRQSSFVDDALRMAVQQCWSVGSLSSVALETTVVVAVSLSQDGRPVTSSIRQIGSEGGTAASVKQAFETARRAIIRCGARGFQLPSDKYDQWKDIEMIFNPVKMRIE